MGYIYAMSDVHGCMDALKNKMTKVDLSDDNKLVFCGDYMDYGSRSGEVLRYIKDLQDSYGDNKVIALKGNHEMMFLEWIDTYRLAKSGATDEWGMPYWNEWLDTDRGFRTLKSLITEEQWNFFEKVFRNLSDESRNIEAMDMIVSSNEDIIRWMKAMPLYYETDTQIFVHAGVDEEAGEYWKWGSNEWTLTGTFAKARGKFCKTVIAGHVGTHHFWHDKHYHEMYYDGESHYYIDGSVYKGGKLILLRYDTETGKYESI